jgi:hypothetical protein
MPVDLDKIASDRADLVKRLFAVSLSVGLASRIAVLPWLQGKSSSPDDLKDVALLFLSSMVVVLSWDGYLAALQVFKLRDIRRFYLDVVVVILYLILLLCSHSNAIPLWTEVLAAVFVVYVAWDLLTKLAYPAEDCGIMISLVWAVYFLAISFRSITVGENFIILVMIVFYGLVLYRIDKAIVFNSVLRVALAIAPFVVVCGITRVI